MIASILVPSTRESNLENLSFNFVQKIRRIILAFSPSNGISFAVSRKTQNCPFPGVWRQRNLSQAPLEVEKRGQGHKNGHEARNSISGTGGVGCAVGVLYWGGWKIVTFWTVFVGLDTCRSRRLKKCFFSDFRLYAIFQSIPTSKGSFHPCESTTFPSSRQRKPLLCRLCLDRWMGLDRPGKVQPTLRFVRSIRQQIVHAHRKKEEGNETRGRGNAAAGGIRLAGL